MDDIFLSIIIPAHNEAERLPASLQAIHAFLAEQPYTAEVLVIENGSSDGTAAVVRGLEPSMPELRLVSVLPAGKGLAVRTGMLMAAGEFRFMADADLSMPIAGLQDFIRACQAGADVVIGSREAKGAQRIGEPAYRHTVGRVFNMLVRLIALPGIQDSQCGFKCFSAAAARRIFALQTLDKWSFDVEALFIARELGYRIGELPIVWEYRSNSRVKVLRDSFRMLSDLLSIRWNGLRGKYREETPLS